VRTASAIARKWATIPRCGGLLYIGEACSRCVAPAASISRDRAIAFLVSFDAAPATTGTRPAVCSTVIRTTRRCSSTVIVAASPVDPQGTTKWTPLAICQSTKDRRERSSISPDWVNGVTSAVPQPVSRREFIC